ncbi:MAG: hypothetical protein FJ211_02310 [Ignavibacteria bacterium]|nr:hypothetical protein [Ignavibacteria bacterium]
MTRIPRLLFILLFASLPYPSLVADDDMEIRLGFLAYIVGSQSTVRPDGGKRMFTLQPSLDRTIGVMQGYAEIIGSSKQSSWRIAFQDGWFPRANYTGDDYSFRFLQEASFTSRITDDITYSIGLLPSHIGYESMIARDNATLSRSFTADNTPYYETGISSTYNVSAQLSSSILLLNGWQRIVDVNDDLSAGTALKWRPDSTMTISWNTYVGNDQPRDKPSLTRFHNNVWCEWSATDNLTVVGLLDLCLQEKPTSGMSNQWYAGVAARYACSRSIRIASRIERYFDPDAIIVSPPVMGSFAATAGLVNNDYDVTEYVRLRGECRRIEYNGLFINASTNGARSSETYFTLSVSTRLTTGPL